MHVSFTHQGDWFVFGEDGRTISRGFHTKASAQSWAMAQRFARPVQMAA